MQIKLKSNIHKNLPKTCLCLNLNLVFMTLQLSGHRTGLTAELGIIFVIAVVCLHNQFAVGKEGIICAISRQVCS